MLSEANSTAAVRVKPGIAVENTKRESPGPCPRSEFFHQRRPWLSLSVSVIQDLGGMVPNHRSYKFGRRACTRWPCKANHSIVLVRCEPLDSKRRESETWWILLGLQLSATFPIDAEHPLLRVGKKMNEANAQSLLIGTAVPLHRPLLLGTCSAPQPTVNN
ncbi:hypothetical protein BDW02DRAFT_70148 [Decorospora gaudefroyi]|uniref:Uncharacterized protein n=1 Tax=Decorospora gaudefroyi TaxID=184978 RepID=A0A6A5K264_9PLEO|nr:hypothetical protein BDW02DRAFT_70148 [Decorospora gaudefroyi]